MATTGYKVTFTDHLFDRIADIGYDPTFGARPLRRAIQQVVENNLAQEVLKGSLLPDKEYVVDLDDNSKLIITSKS